VTATLDAAASIRSGGELEVSWTGPDNTNDYITIVDLSLSEEEQRHDHFVYTRNGNPAKLRVPDEPGNYELRYVQSQSRTVLAVRPLSVREAP